MTSTGRFAVVSIVVLGLLGPACGSDSSTERSGPPATITVFAASSLTAAFTDIADAFIAENPDVDVTLNFAGSSDLVRQIGEGAPADVFASADLANMAKVTDTAGASDPVVFATNVAEIIVEKGNPKGITGVTDLADSDLVVVQCAPEVPCGTYAMQVLANAGVAVTPKSLEENVKGVVTKVTLGEADAGIVYRTDVLAAGDKAAGVEIPADVNVVAQYPIAVTAASGESVGAQAFVEFVLSTDGQDILATSGFGPS